MVYNVRIDIGLIFNKHVMYVIMLIVLGVRHWIYTRNNRPTSANCPALKVAHIKELVWKKRHGRSATSVP